MIGVGLPVTAWVASRALGSLRFFHLMMFVALLGPVTGFCYTIRDVPDKITSAGE